MLEEVTRGDAFVLGFVGHAIPGEATPLHDGSNGGHEPPAFLSTSSVDTVSAAALHRLPWHCRLHLWAKMIC